MEKKPDKNEHGEPVLPEAPPIPKRRKKRVSPPPPKAEPNQNKRSNDTQTMRTL